MTNNEKCKNVHNYTKKEKGITLIALVITIIVLLLLATVSISTILGEDGIISKASSAKTQTAIETEKEQLSFALVNCKMLGLSENKDSSLVTASQLQTELNNSYGSGKIEVTGTDILLTVKYLESGREYLITQSGMVINYDDVKDSATEDGTIGIAEDGSIVDMNLWSYVYDSDMDGYLLVDVDGVRILLLRI